MTQKRSPLPRLGPCNILTVEEVFVELGIGDTPAGRAWLDKHGLIHDLAGHPRVIAGDLFEALERSLTKHEFSVFSAEFSGRPLDSDGLLSDSDVDRLALEETLTPAELDAMVAWAVNLVVETSAEVLPQGATRLPDGWILLNQMLLGSGDYEC